MSDNYFTKFPSVNYNGQTVIDITKRAIISSNTYNNPFLFYPISVASGMRTDQIARQYYGDPYQEWLLFLTNQITDPYDSWYMDGDEFNNFLTTKYGSIQISQQKIMYYTNNWYDDPGISITSFDALPIDALKFYTPVYDGYGNIISYSRIQEDWTLNTNYVVSYQFLNTTIPSTFVNDEIVTVTFTANTIGSGQFTYSSSNTINIQHVSGYFQNPANTTVNASSFSLYGTQSGSTVTISNANNLSITVWATAPADAYVYYDPVYYYDYETNKNEANKIINIMQTNYVASTSTQLTKVLNN
jgi:hypothetical protein